MRPFLTPHRVNLTPKPWGRNLWNLVVLIEYVSISLHLCPRVDRLYCCYFLLVSASSYIITISDLFSGGSRRGIWAGECIPHQSKLKISHTLAQSLDLSDDTETIDSVLKRLNYLTCCVDGRAFSVQLQASTCRPNSFVRR
jgi:hypothetical protein